MEIQERNLQELQEKLILIYKYVSQEKLYEKFFFENSGLVRPYRYRNKLLEELVKMTDSVEFLKTCILEVAEIKEGKPPEKISFIDILEKQDTVSLLHKYGLAKLEDVQDLDLTDLLE